MSNRKTKKNKKNAKKLILPLMILGIIALAAIGFNIYLSSEGQPVDPQSGDSIVLEIPGGAGTAQIATILEDNNLIKSGFVFRLKSKISGYDGDYKAGTYTFSQSMTMKQIMEIIMGGRSVGETFQIIEGLTIEQIAASLEEQNIVDQDEFLDEAENGSFDYDFMQYLPDGPNRLEGFLFPNQYEAPINADAHQIIDIMLGQFDKVFPKEDYDKAKALGYDVYDVVIVASLIEREVREDKERPLVASVVYNRLEQGMRLEFCSTVQYILGEPQAVLSIADTKIESPYNTYLHQGLPPGPICSPGEAAIDAALAPEDTSYLYFVLKSADGTTHNFSSTYAEFLVDKEAYKATL
jgi:UPF0755 protein